MKFTGRKRFYDALDTCYRDGNAEAMVYLIDECLINDWMRVLAYFIAINGRISTKRNQKLDKEF